MTTLKEKRHQIYEVSQFNLEKAVGYTVIAADSLRLIKDVDNDFVEVLSNVVYYSDQLKKAMVELNKAAEKHLED